MRPVELESRVEKGSGPPRSAASLGDQGVGHSLSARSSAAEIQTGLRIAIAYLPADRPNLDQPPLRPEDLPPRRGRTSAGIVVAGARAVRTPSASYPRGRTFKSSPRYYKDPCQTPFRCYDERE